MGRVAGVPDATDPQRVAASVTGGVPSMGSGWLGCGPATLNGTTRGHGRNDGEDAMTWPTSGSDNPTHEKARFVLPPHVQASVQRILDAEARRQLADKLD